MVAGMYVDGVRSEPMGVTMINDVAGRLRILIPLPPSRTQPSARVTRRWNGGGSTRSRLRRQPARAQPRTGRTQMYLAGLFTRTAQRDSHLLCPA